MLLPGLVLLTLLKILQDHFTHASVNFFKLLLFFLQLTRHSVAICLDGLVRFINFFIRDLDTFKNIRFSENSKNIKIESYLCKCPSIFVYVLDQSKDKEELESRLCQSWPFLLHQVFFLPDSATIQLAPRYS